MNQPRITSSLTTAQYQSKVDSRQKPFAASSRNDLGFESNDATCSSIHI
ncbi:hypothetical protein [Thermoflavimicrobium daqui]|nr:hypothetical protein [Thermoflavimicrobium daqui]